MPHFEKLIFGFGVYEGETDPNTGLRHGHGTLTYANGNTYKGQWVLGAATGSAVKVWANGDRYDGQFLAGKKHGTGAYYFANGAVYEGGYEEDAPSGDGIQRMPNGDVYSGEWRCGRRHGRGVEVLHTGHRFEGTFIQGKKNGDGVLTTLSEIIKGIWEGDRCVEVASREAVPAEDSGEQADVRAAAGVAPMPMAEMLAEMEAAGLDPLLLNQISQFNTNVFGQMNRVMTGLGSLDDHLHDLEGCLDNLADLGEGDAEAH